MIFPFKYGNIEFVKCAQENSNKHIGTSINKCIKLDSKLAEKVVLFVDVFFQSDKDHKQIGASFHY